MAGEVVLEKVFVNYISLYHSFYEPSNEEIFGDTPLL